MANNGFIKLAVLSVVASAALQAATVSVTFTAQQLADAYNQTYTFSGAQTRQTGTGWLGGFVNGYSNSTLESNFFGRSGVAGAATNPMNGASAAAIILDFYLVPDNPTAQITPTVLAQTTSVSSSLFAGTGMNVTPSGFNNPSPSSYRQGLWTRFSDTNLSASPFNGITTFNFSGKTITGGASYTALNMASTFFALG
jgi:hypothetical protein